jgi:hypothetical protein
MQPANATAAKNGTRKRNFTIGLNCEKGALYHRDRM